MSDEEYDNLSDEERVEAIERITAEAVCPLCGGFHLSSEALKTFGATPERGLLSNGKPMLCNGQPTFDKQVILDYLFGDTNKGWYDDFKRRRGIPCYTPKRNVAIPSDLFGTPCTAVLDERNKLDDVLDRDDNSLVWVLSDAHLLGTIREYAILHYVEPTPEPEPFLRPKGRGQKLPVAECRNCFTVYCANFASCSYCGSTSLTLLKEAGEMFRVPTEVIGTEVYVLVFHDEVIEVRTKIGETLNILLCPGMKASLLHYIKESYDYFPE